MYKCVQLSLSAAGLLLSVSHCVQSSLSTPTTVSVPACTIITQCSLLAYYCQCPTAYSGHIVCLLYAVSVPARTVVTQCSPPAYYCQCPSVSSRHSVRLLLSSSCHSVRLLLSVSRCVQSSLDPPATVTVVQSSFSPPTTVSVPICPVVTQSDYYSQCTDASSRPVSVTHSHAFSCSQHTHKNLMLNSNTEQVLTMINYKC